MCYISNEEFIMANTEIKTIKLLPLKGAVVFPSVSTSLDVGRGKSIKALENAMASNQLVFLTNQKDVTITDPGKDDVHDMGTVAHIKQLVKMPNGAVRAFVDGKYRAKLHVFIDRGEYLEAEIERIPVEDAESLTTIASIRTLKEVFEDFRNHFRNSPDDEIERILALEDFHQMVDQLTSILPIPHEKQQELLEVTDLNERIIALIKVINFEKEINQLKNKIDQDVKTSIDAHQREFYLREQMKVIQTELSGKDGRSDDAKELSEKLIAAEMPEEVYTRAMKELDRFNTVPQSSPESAVIRTYLTWLSDLPWSKQSKGIIDLKRVQAILDQDHYGLDKVKERIIEFLAVQKLTKSLKAPIICLVGPPGVGKTSLAKSIARATKREFVRVSLGGVRDEAEIRGHRRTYIGAMPGRIIQGIKKAGTNNPVFLLDEIDKMSSDFRGDPSSAMLEVLDPEQNHTFSDHYIEEAFDLSKVMFIATANSLSGIPSPLRDRMEIIEVSSYTEIEKFHIAKNHLVPKQLKQHGLPKAKVQFQAESLKTIIQYYTREAGVRSLERQIGTVCRKITRKFVENKSSSVDISPTTITDLLGKKQFEHRNSETESLVGVAMGLAYTSFGGDILQIEVSLCKGKGKLELTGKLGDVMKESAQTAFSYVRANAAKLGIAENFYEKTDIHIHVPEGAVPKDGPSAGITITTALVSALTNKPVNKDIGMTGEVTLRGRVLPIGGLKEKSISAHRSGLKTIICPKKNEKDLDDIPQMVKDEIKYIFVTDVEEVLQLALLEK